MSGSNALGGVLSGIDYDVLIENTMVQYYTPRTRAQQEIVQYESKQTAIEQIQSQFESLQSYAETLGNANTLRAVSGSSSDSTKVSVVTSSAASEGTHQVEINQLAQSHRMVHDVGLADLFSQVGNGGTFSTSLNGNTVADTATTWFTPTNDATYTYQFAGEDAIEVTFEAGQAYSMQDVVDAINEASQATSGYDMASIDGTGPYSLQLSAKLKGEGELTVTHETGTEAVAVLASDQWTNTDGTDVADGVFSYSYNGVTRNLSTTGDTTLEDLRDLINNDGSNPGITASIISHNNAYHLVLAGNNTGEDYTITIDSTATTVDVFDNDASQWIVSQTARNAKFRVDGYPIDPDWMESNSNTITDVIPGVELNLQNTTDVGSPVIVTLTRNTTKVMTALSNMVKSYNELAETIELYTGYNTDSETGGILQGDSTINSLLNSVRSVLTGTLTGFTSANDTYTMAAEIGIDVDREGLMTLDSTMLSDALEENYEKVIRLLGAAGRGVTDSNYMQFSSALESTKAGTYEIKADFSGGVLDKAYIRKTGQSTWHEAVVEGNTITGAEGYDEEGLAVTVTWDGVSTSQTSELRLQNGLAASLSQLTDTILDTNNGPLALRDDSYEKAIDTLEDKIDRIQDRIDTKLTTLQKRYARLEATLAQLEGLNSQYSALFSQLSTSNKDE